MMLMMTNSVMTETTMLAINDEHDDEHDNNYNDNDTDDDSDDLCCSSIMLYSG